MNAAQGKVIVASGMDERAVPYVEALRVAGLPEERIFVLSPGAGKPGNPAELIAGAAGLVLSGGLDVAPELYGEATLPEARVEVYPERDVMEWELLAGARARKLPVWCVCRGIQVANVFLGGTLWQDLPTQRPGAVPHEVSVPPDSLAHGMRPTDRATGLGERLTREAVLVNSRHHQAIKDLAPGLKEAARSPDGLIEAVELAGPEAEGWWLRGVQWHPENLIAMALQRSLWEDFVGVVA